LILPAVATLQHSFGIIFDYSATSSRKQDGSNHVPRNVQSAIRQETLSLTKLTMHPLFPPYIHHLSAIHQHRSRDTRRNDPLKWTSSLLTADMTAPGVKSINQWEKPPWMHRIPNLHLLCSSITITFSLRSQGNQQSCWIATSKTSGSLGNRDGSDGASPALPRGTATPSRFLVDRFTKPSPPLLSTMSVHALHHNVWVFYTLCSLQ
jgi:hypothetical protein